jgi:hypothetical protein
LPRRRPPGPERVTGRLPSQSHQPIVRRQGDFVQDTES